MMRSEQDNPLDDDLDRQALMQQMAGAPAAQSRGFVGRTLDKFGSQQPGRQPSAAPTAAVPEAAPVEAPPAPKYGKDIGNRDYMDWRGINAEKFNGDHDSPKYQVLRTLSHFDPSQGATPEVIAALNQLGLGTFSGAKDKIRVGGQVDPRFEGFTEMDLIQGFNDPNNKTKTWGYGASNPNAPQQAAAPAPGMMGGPSALDGVAQQLAPQDQGFNNILQQKLMEILGNPDRSALLSQLQK